MPIIYSNSDKKKILDFIEDYNNKHGRGGKKRASEQFGVAQLTLRNWFDCNAISKRIKQKNKPNTTKSQNVNFSSDSILSRIDKIEVCQNKIEILKAKIDKNKQAILIIIA